MPESDAAVPWTGDAQPVTVRGGGRLPAGFHIEAHAHVLGQLVYAASGAVATSTDGGGWITPPNRITWTPSGFEHAHHFHGETDVRVLDVPPDLARPLAPQPSVYEVTPLLREALLALTEHRDRRPGAARRLLAVVVDELVEVPEQTLHLPEPRDPRLRSVTAALHADPAHSATLAELGALTGTSERTLSRLFRTELGMAFPRWRSLLRVQRALILLADGCSVTDTAMECGWSNPSSFIDTFTAIVGLTPGRFAAHLAGGAG